ncbi:MAG TPA: 30S ribosomal protein S3 [Spirochaetota bacterium]|nr:30S ribosomal protein S3 [Spirochaetota bacterium]
MGQKANPKGLRLKINQEWESNWYAEKERYSDYLIEDIKLRKFIYKYIIRNKKYRRVEISDILIKRFPDSININIYTSRPGSLIGKKGQDIELLRKQLTRLVGEGKNINLNINEVKKVDLDARVVSQSVGKMIEGRMNYKKAMKQSISRAVRSGAKGIKIQVTGRLGGADMARCESFKEGSIPLHTFNALVDYAKYDALTTYGIIGVTTWIHKGSSTNEAVDAVKKSI